MQKVITSVAYLVISLAFLSIFGWAVKHYAKDNALGTFVGLLDMFETAVEEVQTLPKTFVPTPLDFEAVNKLESDLFGLVSFSNESEGRTIQILNLKDGKSHFQWDLANPHNSHNRIMNPVMLPEKRLVYGFLGAPGLSCVDSLGNEIWKQQTVQNHHAMNLDHNGDVWVCDYAGMSFILRNGAKYTIVKDQFGKPVDISFIDNFITLVSNETGDVLYKKSVSQILLENDLQYLILKSPNVSDPLHLNDIEPVIEDGPHWKKGDVFLSFRTNSTVLHFRPSTGEVIKVIEGPFHSQHDVDLLNDSVIGIFNNNGQTLSVKESMNNLSEAVTDFGVFASNIVTYNYSSKEFETHYKDVFEKNRISTYTEGLFQTLSDGSVFVEEQNSSILWVINDDEVVYKNVLHSHHDGHHHLLNWTRIIE